MEMIIKSAIIAEELETLWPVSPEHSSARDDTIKTIQEEGDSQMSIGSADISQPGVTGHQEVAAETRHVASDGHDLPDDSSEAEEIVLHELKERAMEAGYDVGYKKGETEAKLKYEVAINTLTELVGAGKDSVLLSLKNIDALIGSIVFEAVCKIIGTRLTQAEVCREVILQVIKNTQHEDILSVKISPRDFERLQLQAQELHGDEDTNFFKDVLMGLKVEADVSIALGGCVVKLRDGLIDGTVETQLQMLAQSIKEVVNQG